MKRFSFVLSIMVLCGVARAESAPVEAALDGPVQPLERVADYRKILQACTRNGSSAVLAIRDMKVDGRELLLTVDPQTLQTRLEAREDWTCAQPGPEMQESRYLKAVEFLARSTGKQPAGADFLENAGLTHGRDNQGVFVTGDLCPSHKPLDRSFLLQAERLDFPVALSVTGVWVRQHKQDFLWLRQEEAARRLKLLWVNHSFHHPYAPGVGNSENFILTPGLDAQVEILDVERLLIANGETPSVFFRYPGLISDREWMERLRDANLIPLGADAWLALGEKPKPGGVILVHPNGNEPAGLSIFERLNHRGALPLPFRTIMEAP